MEELKDYDLKVSLIEGNESIVSKEPALKSNFPSISNGVTISYKNESCEFSNMCYSTYINRDDYLWIELLSMDF